MRLGLYRVDQVRKLDRVLNEEDGYVIADEIEDAFVGVKLHSESPDITSEIRGTPRAGYRRKSNEYGRLFFRILKEAGFCITRHRLIHLEVTVRSSASCVNDTLWNSLVIEVGDLFAKDEVFEQ